MNSVRRNVAANYVGQAWLAVINLALVPVYISMLGIEAFGLIGFFLTLQAFAALFDAGIAPTLNRELARGANAPAQRARDLVRSLELVYWPIGALFALLTWACAGLLATRWLNPVDLSADRTSQAVALMGLAIAAQWPAALYSAGLNGLQRQVLVNGLTVSFVTLRNAGVLLPLMWVQASVEMFFAWFAFAGAVQAIVSAVVLWRCLPASGASARFDPSALREVAAFAIGSAGVAVLGFVLLYADRIVLSRLLPLDEFGVYSVAATAAAFLVRLSQPWFVALFPRLSQLVGAGQQEATLSLYHRGTQWLAALSLPVTGLVVAFSGELLFLWTRSEEIAGAAGPILSVLALAMTLNLVASMPYVLQLAHGWTSLALKCNLAVAVIAVPLLHFAGLAWGASGAAWIVVCIHASFVFVTVPLMHRRLAIGELRAWYLRDLAPVVLSVSAAISLCALFVQVPRSVAGAIALLGALLLGTIAVALLSSPAPRAALSAALRRMRSA